MSQLILIDADILVYSIAFSVETPIYVVKNGVYKTKTKAEQAAAAKGAEVFKRVNIGSERELKKNLDNKLKEIFDNCGSTKYQMYITASKVEGNFRSKIATLMPYKGNRTKLVRPYHYNTIRRLLRDDYGAIVVEGQEADDQLAIDQTSLFNKNGNYDHSIIASIDKDLRTVPGWHYHIKFPELSFVTEEEALKNFYKQLLTGDGIDNIPGITKLLRLKGRVEEANKLSYSHYVKEFDEKTVDYSAEDTYNYVIGMYEGLGFGDKEIDEIGNLLWLRRYPGQLWSEDRKK